ncbi:carbohydrate ABC transporter permease [Leifsonia poae]|uniref:carbohydrate ABC transporter permease n=1 Tax=Leifsonia poae TaxID=110933 RepID=UPI001CBAF8E0|nr:sugar ABC transporter permease [Leifsonia poae]
MTTTAAVRSGSASRRPRRHRTRRAAWLFVLPLVIVNLLVIGGPGIASFVFSFTDWDGLGEAHFIGLQNYIELFQNPDVLSAVGHNLLWTLFFLVVPISMALLGAFLLSRIQRGQALFRVLYFIPYVLATIVSATIWRQILSPTQGIGPALSNLGLTFFDGVNFLGDPTLALGAVAFVNNWQWWGFLLVLFLAAMQGVNPALYEAARLDGASAWREFWHITLPGIRPTFMFLMLMTVIWSFLVFDYIFILTQGGPAGSTDVLATVLYRTAFSEQRAGYASAMAMLLSAISAIVVAAYLFLRKKLDWDV